jgi:O-antigen/teichoic acid export membrane protein
MFRPEKPVSARQYLRAGIAWCRAALQPDLQARLAHNTLLVFAGHLVRLLLGLISSVLLARSLGPAGLSVFSVVSAAMNIGITLADCGLSNSAIRQIAGDLTTSPDQAYRTAGAYARFKLLAGMLLATGAAVLVAPIGALLNLPRESASLLIWAGSLGVLATALSGIVATILHALRRFWALVLTQTLNIGLTVVLMAGLFFAAHLTVLPALLVGIVTALAAASLGFALLPPDWRAALRAGSRFRSPEGRRLLAFSKWLWLSAILSVVASQLDLLLLNRWATPTIVGFYALALNLAFKVDILNQTVRAVLLPTVSALADKAAYVAYIRRSIARSLFLSLALVALLPLVRPFVLMVYGAAYAGSIAVFYALMIVILFELVTVPLLLLAFPMDMPRLIAAADGLRVVVLVAVGSLLIPGWGMYGAVAAKLAASVAGALVIGTAIAMRLRTAQCASS